jgi:hypothetical protein
LLVSELEPSVSGPDFLSQITSVLKRIKKAEPYLEILEGISQKLKNLDTELGNSVDKYLEFTDYIKQIETKFDISFLFQTDLAISTTKNVIDESVSESLKKGISFLNRISIPPQNTLLSRF